MLTNHRCLRLPKYVNALQPRQMEMAEKPKVQRKHAAKKKILRFSLFILSFTVNKTCLKQLSTRPQYFFSCKQPLKLNDLFISCGTMEAAALQLEFCVHTLTASTQSDKPHMFSMYWNKSGRLSSCIDRRPPIHQLSSYSPLPQAHLMSPQEHMTTATLAKLANKHARLCAAGLRPMPTHIHYE